MKTITYNPDTHRLVPVEPTEEMFEQMVTALCVADGYKKAVLVATQPEPVEVDPLFWYRPIPVSGGDLYEGPIHNDSICGKWMRDERPTEWKPLYTAPPDYEAVKKQRDELAKALESIIVAANDSDESCYGTLATRFVRDIAEPALASVKGGA